VEKPQLPMNDRPQERGGGLTSPEQLGGGGLEIKRAGKVGPESWVWGKILGERGG